MSSDLLNRMKSLENSIFEEIGESPPENALLFNGADISLISGRSRDLMENGYEPFNCTHLNTQHALMLTQALAKLHASTLTSARKDSHAVSNVNGSCIIESIGSSRLEKGEMVSTCKTCTGKNIEEDTESKNISTDSSVDPLTNLISQPSIVETNLSIMMDDFKNHGVPLRILVKLAAIRQDVDTITGFLKFLSSSQTSKYIPSVGPISMSDIWIPNKAKLTNDLLVIRLRGGVHLKALPIRDISWVWLTLVHPLILQERHIELCQSYCIAFNNATSSNNNISSIDLSDIVGELGENFLHSFLTIVHKFVASGVWALDRQLHTHEGIRSLSSSISFLIDNGIVGPIFVS